MKASYSKNNFCPRHFSLIKKMIPLKMPILSSQETKSFLLSLLIPILKQPLKKQKKPPKDTIMVSSEGLVYIAFIFDYLPSISSLQQINRADLG